MINLTEIIKSMKAVKQGVSTTSNSGLIYLHGFGIGSSLLVILLSGLLLGCFNQNLPELDGSILPNNVFIEAIHLNSLKAENKDDGGDYVGHYLNPKAAHLIKNSDLHGQVAILLYCIIKLDAREYDGELAYEFKQLFIEPFGFERVVNEASRICETHARLSGQYSEDEIRNALMWLGRYY